MKEQINYTNVVEELDLLLDLTKNITNRDSRISKIEDILIDWYRKTINKSEDKGVIHERGNDIMILSLYIEIYINSDEKRNSAKEKYNEAIKIIKQKRIISK